MDIQRQPPKQTKNSIIFNLYFDAKIEEMCEELVKFTIMWQPIKVDLEYQIMLFWID